MAADPPPLIVTALLDRASFEFFDSLRRLHFPPERNFLAAHLTLFHYLPGGEVAAVKSFIEKIANGRSPFNIHFNSIRSLGRGVAVNAEAAELIKIRGRLAAEFEPWLTPQDRQKFQPHITIQNKVEPAVAKELFELMTGIFEPFNGRVEGFQVWHYLGGPWSLETEFRFCESSQSA
jgi:2'-5' RNA ligase